MAQAEATAVSKPGMKLPEDLNKKFLEAGLSVDEVKIIEVFRHVHFGRITVYKKAGNLEGRIEFKETY